MVTCWQQEYSPSHLYSWFVTKLLTKIRLFFIDYVTNFKILTSRFPLNNEFIPELYRMRTLIWGQYFRERKKPPQSQIDLQSAKAIWYEFKDISAMISFNVYPAKSVLVLSISPMYCNTETAVIFYTQYSSVRQMLGYVILESVKCAAPRGKKSFQVLLLRFLTLGKG